MCKMQVTFPDYHHASSYLTMVLLNKKKSRGRCHVAELEVLRIYDYCAISSGGVRKS